MITTIKNLNKFVSVFKIVSSICMETDIVCSLDKIIIRAVHPSNHCMIIFEIKSSFFDTYDIKKETVYTIDIPMFLKIISKFKKELNIDFTTDFIKFKNSKVEYNLNYFVGSKDTRNNPCIDYGATWTITSENLFKAVADVIDFSEVCKLEGKEELKIYTKSNLVNGNLILDTTKHGDKDCCCFYDVKYINDIKELQNIFSEVELGFDEDTPITIKSNLNDINFKFVLAGRVE
jgi:DNA polymerase III sliding clamp (beta) subunit (PCNA family)